MTDIDIQKFIPEAEHAALVVVDIQERLAAAMPEDVCKKVVANTRILIESAGILNLPVLVTEQYPKGLGPTVPELAEALADAPRIEKIAFSCCGEPAFTQAVEAAGRHDIILCGMEAHVCIYQTALDLLGRNLRVFVAADAVCSRNKMNRSVALDLMRQADAVIGSTETFLFQMLKEAGTEAFKGISRLVK